MNMRKSGGGDGKGGEGRASVTVNFTALAVEACSGPLTCIAIDAGPDIPFVKETLSCLNTGMGKIMKRIEEGVAKCLWNERSWLTSGNIAGKRGGGCGDNNNKIY